MVGKTWANWNPIPRLLRQTPPEKEVGQRAGMPGGLVRGTWVLVGSGLEGGLFLFWVSSHNVLKICFCKVTGTVLVSPGYCNKVAWTARYKTTEIYLLSDLEAESLKSVRKNPPRSPPGFCWLAAAPGVLGIELRHSSLCHPLRLPTSPLCLSPHIFLF